MENLYDMMQIYETVGLQCNVFCFGDNKNLFDFDTVWQFNKSNIEINKWGSFDKN